MWNVMIADDENYMLEAMANLIDWKKMDCQLVFKAKNGQMLLEQIKENPPDIIITDIKMPLVSGIDVAKYIYENELPIKVIILSAYADFSYAQEAIKYDVCGYLIKTSVIEMLPAMIDKAIKQLSGRLDNKESEEKYSDDLLGRLQKYIADHYTDKVSLGQIAQAIHANGSYLSRLYKSRTGQNLFDVINKMKLDKAKEYMNQGYRIYEVAQKVGFEDVSYFSRVFRKHEGCSPREYENKLREEKQIQNEDNKH
ncbi:MAG: response regulator [Lachnospiraceae bacterium]|nr:response regulator [Lachnospiraceae bacterium]